MAGIRINDKKLFLWLISLLLPLFLICSLDYPVNVDELLHYPHAVNVIEWYGTAGENKACFDTPWSNLKHYGQSVDNLTALINKWVNPDDPYKTRHITGAFFGWLLILFTSLLAFELTGRYRTAIYTALLLLLIPAVMGQYCNNLKDIPFAAGYALALYSMIRCFKRLPYIPWKYIFQLSVAIAFLVSVRVGGIIIFPYLFLFFIIWIILRREDYLYSPGKIKEFRRLLFQIPIILVIGYFGGLLFWPYGLVDPVSHPLESLSMMKHYDISIRQIFQGDLYWSTSLPDNYLFTWMAISLPVIVLLGLLLYLITLIKSQDKFSFYEFIILFSFVFPLVYTVSIGSNFYSGWRQMYFLAVPLSIISALGIERTLNLCIRKMIVLIPLSSVLVITAIPPVIHYIRNPDTAYIYFNKITGGNRNAWSKYEYDYYGHGMKEAVEWLDDNIEMDETLKTVASNIDISVYLKHRSDIQTKYVHYNLRSSKEWDYGIFGVNYIHPYQLKNNTWQPANIQKMIRDSDNPLAIVIKRSTPGDYTGVNHAKNGRFMEAILPLEEAIQSDENNHLLYEYLAESYYHMGKIEECVRTIGLGKQINPLNEKLNMIEAQLDFDRGDYTAALEICLFIVENNGKYYNIVPLLIACYEKTGDMDMAMKLKKRFDIR
ncbi:phospholipid carrier-dependent glycosyltransferase [Bacteroidota bacterium]